MTRPLRVGIQLPHAERDIRWSEYEAIARAAEEVGFDSIWLGDHLLFRDEEQHGDSAPWDTWTMLAALASVTSRVQLGPLVACLGFVPPGVLARMAAAVDEISGGRLVLGVGAGWHEAEFRAFGLPFDHRASRFAEEFAVLRQLLSGERVTFEGRYVRVDGAVLLPRPARRPPLMIGSTGERVLGIALPHVESWNTWYDLYGNNVEGFRRESAKVTAAAELAGRDPAEIERSGCVFVVLDRASKGRPITDEAPPVEGPPERIAEHLSALAAAGASEAIIVVDPITERSVRTLGEAIAHLDAGPDDS
jgi:probable F420-dependent oxidoreductase